MREMADIKWLCYLQVVLLDVGPEELHELGAGRLLLADEIGELGAELLGLGESSSSGHDVDLGMGLRAWERSGLTSRAVKMKLRLETSVTRLKPMEFPSKIQKFPLFFPTILTIPNFL